MKKTYIGDGIYMEISSVGEVLLTTENGITVTNSIIMEPAHMELIFRHYSTYKDQNLKV